MRLPARAAALTLDKLATEEYHGANILTTPQSGPLIDFIAGKKDAFGLEQRYRFNSLRRRDDFIDAARILVATEIAADLPDLRVEILEQVPAQ